MTRVITVTSGKGGVGKTTTTANLGTALARLGQRVVIIDTDIGLRNLDVVMGLQNRIVYDVVDLVEGRCRLRQALIRDRTLENLYLLPAAQSRDKTAVSPADMMRVIQQLHGDCDIVLIDSPAGIESGFRNAVAPAEAFILVTTPDVSSVQDVDRVLGILEAEGRGETRLVINRIRPELVRRSEMMSPDEILDRLNVSLLGLVPDNEGVLISNSKGMPIAHDARSLPGRAYHNMARRLLGEDVAFIPLLARRKSLWERIGLGKRSKD
ncbi:MAG TPA: septum site-determining protein MinD [Chloroflexi bacterium]|jgi:septum site-determining protein MinD|nr:septum site-determining protein MinD [Chloroflexota bacterium]